MSNKSETISFRLESDILQEVDSMAKLKRKQRSTMVRELIQRGLVSAKEGSLSDQILKSISHLVRDNRKILNSVGMLGEITTHSNKMLLLDMLIKKDDAKTSKLVEKHIEIAANLTNQALNDAADAVVKGKDKLSLHNAETHEKSQKTAKEQKGGRRK